MFLLSTRELGKKKLKKQTGTNLANIILIAIVVFLAVNVGFFLYNPNGINPALPFSTLKIIGGNTQVQSKNSLAWEKAVDGMVLEPGSRVRTDPDSYASIIFSQGTTTKLEPGTDVIVAELESNQDNQLNTITLKQQSGKTWNQVTRLADDSYHFKIQTSSADVKVRGTLFATEVDESGKTTVQTTEGAVNVAAQGKEMLIPAGKQTTVAPGAAPSLPAPIPAAKKEIVLTISKPAIGLIVDPSGSSTGYLPDGAPLNQISGSQLSSPEAASQTVRIREPVAGDYTLILRGVTDGSATLNVQGLAEGKSTLFYAESCNVSTENNFVLKLHLDVLNGLFGKTSVLASTSPGSQAGPATTTLKTTTVEKEKPTISEKEETAGQKESWLRIGDNYITNKLVIIAGIVVFLAGILLLIWKKI